jgi:hypothetical protein
MYLIYGTIALFLITVFITYVYIKKPSYGITLAIVSVILIAVAIFWNLTEDSRNLKATKRIPLQQLELSQQSLQPAYGNRYLYQAKLSNHSQSNQLVSIQLQLALANEKINKKAKIWLDAANSQKISIYFSSTELAKEVAEKQWKVTIIASKARN